MSAISELQRVEAREHVQSISKKYGWVSQKTRENLARVGGLTPEAYAAIQELQESNRSLQEGWGSAIVSLATNLYSSEARFLLELVQNAEDNQYTKAKSLGAAPFINFKLYPDKVIVDCNEDGFTREQVDAVCRTAGSTKVGEEGYIGEKGIGFKSVFMVASKVHIQSGPYSFYFEHERGEKGMGMITPVYEEPTDDLPQPLTRMTLTLGRHCDRQALSKQFDALPDTILLFLKKLNSLSTSKFDLEGRLQNSTEYTSEYNAVNCLATLTRASNDEAANSVECSVQRYHMARKMVTNLSKDDKRKKDVAEVVLAFPISPASEPILTHQDVYAYLPIRDFGFRFLIHSDFITQASRQDIIESPRNTDLLDGIARTFIDAVRKFRDHPKLRYTWMQYLPDNSVSGAFWLSLQPKIEQQLKTIDFLRTWDKGELKSISCLRYISNTFKDKNRLPLLADSPTEIYLDPRYGGGNLEKLKHLGLDDLNYDEFVEKLRYDLKSPRSRMKASTSDDDWHGRVAAILNAFAMQSSGLNTLKYIELVPLKDGSWTSSNAGSIYYPRVDDIDVPTDLGLRLLEPNSYQISPRQELFQRLKVSPVAADVVRLRIFRRYEDLDFKPFRSVPRWASLQHLRYLWWTHDSSYGKLPPSFRVIDHEENVQSPNNIFFDSDKPYSVRDLITPKFESSLKVSFLHPAYLDFPSGPRAHAGHPLWITWLRSYVGIQAYPPLTDRASPSELSGIFRHVMEYQRFKLVGTLMTHWNTYITEMTPELVRKISNSKVTCLGADSQATALNNTFLPLTSLCKLCREFSVFEIFPLLLLSSRGPDKSMQKDWGFLTLFGVGAEKNLSFYLQILECVLTLSNKNGSWDKHPQVTTLYEAMQHQCRGHEDDHVREKRRDTTYEFFKKNPAVLKNPQTHGAASWLALDDCLWNAPHYMKSKTPLKSIYLANRPESKERVLSEFFELTLQIQDATFENFIDELILMRDSESNPTGIAFGNVQDIYCHLDKMRLLNDKDGVSIREQLESEELIYVPQDEAWLPPSSCLWSTKAQISGKSTISNHYSGLEDFFVDFLDVSTPTIDMLLTELRFQVASRRNQPPFKVVRELIWAVNSLLPCEIPVPKESLDGYSLFPVRFKGGLVELQSSRKDFAIVDRQKLFDMFNDRAAILDFDLEEVRKLRPFLNWLGLEDRYLSRQVKEKSTLKGGLLGSNIELTRRVNRQAHAIYRCAVHFDSPRTRENDQTLYRLFARAEVFETESISSELVLCQNGKDIIHEELRSKLHIEEETKKPLRIYVPRNIQDRKLCYARMLPERLLSQVIMEIATTGPAAIIDPAAGRVMTAIMNNDHDLLEFLLEDFGIIKANVSEVSELSMERSTSPQLPDTETGAQTPSTPLSSQSNNRKTEHHQTSRNSEVHETRQETPQTPRASEDTDSLVGTATSSHSPAMAAEGFGTADPTPERLAPWTTFKSKSPEAAIASDSTQSRYASPSIRPLGHPGPPNVFGVNVEESTQEETPQQHTELDNDQEYRELLEKVIEASRTLQIPSQGPFNFDEMRNALPFDSDEDIEEITSSKYPFGRRSDNQLKHDMKIGAAGELLIFEILSRLQVPGVVGTYKLPRFGLENWESTIRHIVAIHPRYAHLRPPENPNQREQADIIYDDRLGDFTKFLLDKGYLPSSHDWNAIPGPKYFIEVKTTTKECSTRFFMSKGQYQRMKEITFVSGRPVQNVYLIFRVYRLGEKDMSFRIYVDPEGMRTRQELVVTAESYSVVPSNGQPKLPTQAADPLFGTPSTTPRSSKSMEHNTPSKAAPIFKFY